MLTGNLALVRLLLCLVIARNVSLCSVSSASPTEEPEVAKVPEASQVVPEASQVVHTSVTPVKPRIVQRTTVLKRANRFDHENNSTSTSNPLNYEDDNSTTPTRLPGPLSYESATRKTAIFRPSIHLGEINGYETRKSSTNPFNSVQHVKFENSVKIGNSDTDGARGVSKTSSFVHGPERATAAVEGGKRNRVKFFETDSRYGIDVPVEHQQQEYFEPEQQNEHAENNDDDDDHHHDHYHNHQHHDHNYNHQHYDNNVYNDPAKVPVDHETLVTLVYPQEHGEVTARPMTLGRPVYPSIISQQVHVQDYKPVTDNVKTIYVKPSKFHGEVEIVTPVPVSMPVSVLVPGPVHIHHYEYGAPASGEAIEKPEVHLHHQGSYEVLPQEGHAAKVPGRVPIHHYEYGAPAGGEAIEKPEVHLHHQGSYEVSPQEGHAAKVPGRVPIQNYVYGAPASGEAIEKPEVHLHHQGSYEVLPQEGHAAKVPGRVPIQHCEYGAPASGEAIQKPEVHLHHQGSYEVLPQEGHAAKVPGRVPIQHYEYGAPASGEAIEKPEVHLHHQGSYEVLPQEGHAAKVPGSVHIQNYVYGAPASGEAIEKPEVHLHHQGSYEVLPQEGHAAKVPGPVHIQHYEYGVPASGEAIEKPEVHLHHQGSYEVLPQEGHAAKVPGPVHIQHYEYGVPASGEAIEKPEVHVHHQGSYEVLPQEALADDTGKPETVLYLTSHRETAYTRTRKFPYKFHHPGLGYQDNEYHFVQEGPHAYPSKGRRISPWKKILHLIGTFIPLGLLLATLTPNVVKIGNTTQSTVVSKLRAVDLPVEHKQARLIDEPDGQQQNTCEDRSICELIVGRSDPISNLLKNILWSLTTKSFDEEAKKHDLHDIFEAVKRKNCSTIDCRRYKDQ